MRLAILLLCTAFSLSSCFEPKEGCLDIAATNFDAAADKDCCCEYPKLVLTVNQVYDTLLFRNDSLYPDAQGRLFRIKSVAFYLSEFELKQNGSPFNVSDTLTLATLEGVDTSSRLFINDFLLVRRTPLSFTVGTFRQDGFFELVKFRLGLSDAAQTVIPSKAPAAHPLATQPDGLWQGSSTGFIGLQAVVVRDSMSSTPPDTLRFTRADLGDFFLETSGSFVHPTGFDFPLILTVDYRQLFDGVNWSSHDISSWKSQIVSNLSASFTVSQ
jgi:hypothetical protein